MQGSPARAQTSKIPEGMHFYCVKKNDSLSIIAYDHLGRPIYSTKGSLEKIKQLNPHIRNENLIYPDEAVLVDPMMVQQCPESKVEVRTETVVMSAQPAPTSVSSPEEGVSFRIEGGAKLERYKLESKTNDFGLDSNSGFLPWLNGEACLKSSLCATFKAALIELPGTGLVRVDGQYVPLFGFEGRVGVLNKDRYRVSMLAGADEIPTFKALATNFLKLDKQYSRYFGARAELILESWRADLKVASYGSISATEGPNKDFLHTAIGASYSRPGFLNGIGFRGEFAMSEYESDRFRQKRIEIALGISKNF